MFDIKPGVFWVSFSQFPQSELLSSGGGAPTKYFSTLFKSSSYLLFSLLLTLVLDFRPTWRIQKCSYLNLFTVYTGVTMVKFKQQIFKTKFSKCSSSWGILFKKHFQSNHFSQCLGAAHPKCWLKYAFLTFLMTKS